MSLPVLATAIPGLIAIMSDLFDGLSGEQKVKAEQAMKLLEMAQAEAEGQRRITQIEAGHRSLFVAGWRPCIGWVCAIGIAYEVLGRPLLLWWSLVYHSKVLELPSIDYVLWELTVGMLGMGGLRTFEKIKGVSK